jgi:hypothetical protein
LLLGETTGFVFRLSRSRPSFSIRGSSSRLASLFDPAMRERPSFKFAEPNYFEDEG